MFVLGTRANRRLFETELFLIYVEQYLSFFFFLCMYMNVLIVKEDVCVCASVHVFCFVLTVRFECETEKKVFGCVNN